MSAGFGGKSRWYRGKNPSLKIFKGFYGRVFLNPEMSWKKGGRMFCIGLAVKGTVSVRQVPARVWATITLWQVDSAMRYDKIRVGVESVEEQTLAAPKQAASSFKSWVVVKVSLHPSADQDAVEVDEDLEKLADFLGLEFGLPSPPHVGFETEV